MYSLALIFTFIKTIHYSKAFHELTLKVIRYNMLSSPFGGFIRKIGKEKRNCKKKRTHNCFLNSLQEVSMKLSDNLWLDQEDFLFLFIIKEED